MSVLGMTKRSFMKTAGVIGRWWSECLEKSISEAAACEEEKNSCT